MAIIAFLCSNPHLYEFVFHELFWRRLNRNKAFLKSCGPVDFPPCILQTDLPFTAGALHLKPLRLDLAEHWLQLYWPKTEQRDSRNWVKVGFIR